MKIIRPHVQALDDILGLPVPVLDHGFCRVIDYLGNDAAVVQAARVSYGEGTKKVSEDRGLIRYLMRKWHTTPSEMTAIKFHFKMPIFVARQFMRHRCASINEYSARYSIMDREFYTPEPDQMAEQSEANKQGRDVILDHETACHLREILMHDASTAFDSYDQMIDPEGANLTRELARIGLPVSTYTQFYWMANLHNLMHFLGLRADSHAQYEIRVYAEVMLDIMRRWVPLTHEAFIDFRKEAVSMSRLDLAVVKRLLAGEVVEQADSGLTKREWRELMDTLGKAAVEPPVASLPSILTASA